MKEAQRRRQNVRKKYCSAVGGPILSCEGREKFLLSTIARVKWRQEIDSVIFADGSRTNYLEWLLKHRSICFDERLLKIYLNSDKSLMCDSDSLMLDIYISAEYYCALH